MPWKPPYTLIQVSSEGRDLILVSRFYDFTSPWYLQLAFQHHLLRHSGILGVNIVEPRQKFHNFTGVALRNSLRLSRLLPAPSH